MGVSEIVTMNPTTLLFPNQVKCLRCRSGYSISEDETQCVETCPN